MKTKQRENNLDLLRIIATFSVILIHINAYWYQKNAIAGAVNLNSIIESGINFVARASVPIFVMLSGAFLLKNKNNKDFRKFYRKTSYKILLPLIFAIVLLFLIGFILKLNGTSIKNTIIGILIGSFYNLWFMYMLMGLYLMVPLIIRLKENISDQNYRNIVIILVIWASISQLFLNNERLAYSIDVVFAFLSYFLLGDLMHSNYRIKLFFRRYNIACIFILMILYVITIIYRAISGYNESIIFAPYISFFSPSVVISSFLVFGIFETKKVRKNYYYLSSKTYYIYLFHTLVYESIFKFFPSVNKMNELGMIILITFSTFFIAFLIAILYSSVWRILEKKFNFKEKYYNLIIWD